MPLPPWTRELFTGSLDDVAKRLQNAETLKELQSKATSLLGDLPMSAARGIDRLMQETRKGSEHLRRWVRRQTMLNVAAINGSGIFFHPLVEGAPLQADAAETMFRADGYFTLNSGLAEKRIDDRLTAELEKRGVPAPLVAHSISAAAAAITASLPNGASIVMPRTCSIRLDGDTPLANLIASAGGKVLEIGTTENCTEADWESVRSMVGPESIALTLVFPGERQAASLAPPPKSLRAVQIVPYACFNKPAGLPEDCFNVLSKDLLEANWLTVVPCNLLLGGPAAALVLGASKATAAISGSPFWRVAQADLPTRAAFVSALETGSEAHVGSEERPHTSLKSLLAVSVDNLQNRAERLATQLAGDAAFQSCRITQEAAQVGPDLPASIPSRQVRITPAGNAMKLLERLEAESPALILSSANDELILDLRWIPSHLDASLAGLLTEQIAAAKPDFGPKHDLS